MQVLLNQRDINQGWNVIEYMAELEMMRMLQISQVTKIVTGLWQSDTDIGGSIFDLATSYDLTFTNKLKYREDNEFRRRFYQPREISVDSAEEK